MASDVIGKAAYQWTVILERSDSAQVCGITLAVGFNTSVRKKNTSDAVKIWITVRSAQKKKTSILHNIFTWILSRKGDTLFKTKKNAS